eukprot:TRINITY_DN33_c1_g5_i1.p1 TRINITY_DN33_c1_g5~~TRINITY_DN33_c1_g5_i1.p1  ORF type:complete len:914 (-),score=181.68 TRINITY_DN33_c1_g5_i1:737-3478(-)
MLPSGSTTPVGGNQNFSPPALLRPNSGLVGAQGGATASQQQGLPSLVSPRSQYCNLNMLGSLTNVPSGNPTIGMNQPFNNGGILASQPTASNAGVPPSLQRGMAMPDSFPMAGSISAAIGSSGISSSLSIPSGSVSTLSPRGHSQMPNFANSSPQISQDQQQVEHQKIQGHQTGQDIVSSLQLQGQGLIGARALQQFQNQHVLGGNQQQQLQSYRSLVGDQIGPQQLQLRNLASMKIDPQQLQSIRNLASVKMEPQGDQTLLLQQQQQQQLLQFSRQQSQQIPIQAAHLNMLQQQRLLQQHHQLLQAFPQSRSQLQQQTLQQNMQVGVPLKSSTYETGMCARRLMQYMFHQQHRPKDNNIDFWRKFVAEYFAPHAKKRWCVSQYGSGRQTMGVFPQDVWHCEICGAKPGRGFETTVEVLPRLCKIKYDSGTLEELLSVDVPKEYPLPSGHIVLEYKKAIQESVFEQLRVVRDGQLRIVFSCDMKICSWEFCARSHEELIPRRSLMSQVAYLGSIAQKYQASVQNGTTNLSSQELQANCNMFVTTARELAKTLEVPLVNDLGYTKRYVRCLQISEVVNSMKDLIDYSRQNKIGPIESLNNFPRRTSTHPNQSPRRQDQNSQHIAVVNEQSTEQPPMPQISENSAMGNITSHANSTAVISGLNHQNTMNGRLNSSTSFTSTTEAPASSPLPAQQSQISPTSSVLNSGSSVSNGMQSSPATAVTSAQLPSVSAASASMLQQQSMTADELDPTDAENSVQHFIQELMMSSQLDGGSPFQPSVGGTNTTGSAIGINSGSGNDLKNLHGTTTNNGSAGLKAANGFGANCLSNNVNVEFNNIGPIESIPNSINALRQNMNATNSNTMALNGRATVLPGAQSLNIQDSNLNLQQDLGGIRHVNGLGTAGSFNSMQFDWKSP